MQQPTSHPGPGRVYLGCKRLIDVGVSAILLLVLGPLLLLISVLIKFDSPGTAVFKQERAGKGMKPFMMYKFRTMRADVDPYGRSPRAGDDPRLTRIGRLLREYSLDELPQLFNVLKGNMSLVGPRPLYMRQAARWNQRQRRSLDLKGGMTGLSQIVGRAGLPIEEKLEVEVQYVEQACVSFDLWIMWKTIAVVFRKQGIYEKRYSHQAEVGPDAAENHQEQPPQ